MTTNAEWKRLWAASADSSPAAARMAVQAAADEAERVIGPHLTTAAYGWSGGKDSLALEVVVDELRRRDRRAVPTGVLGVIRKVEIPSYLIWCQQHLPAQCTVRSNEKIDLAWLAANDRYLFPANGKLGYKWTLLGTRWAQTQHQQEHKVSVMLYGRRTADGNQCGDRQGLMPGHDGPCYNPIRHWSHAQTLSVVRHLWLPHENRAGKPRTMPPIYEAEDGWVSGTGSWPGRHMPWWTSKADGWASTYAIDPQLVYDAAHVIPSARTYLQQTHTTPL